MFLLDMFQTIDKFYIELFHILVNVIFVPDHSYIKIGKRMDTLEKFSTNIKTIDIFN